METLVKKLSGACLHRKSKGLPYESGNSMETMYDRFLLFCVSQTQSDDYSFFKVKLIKSLIHISLKLPFFRQNQGYEQLKTLSYGHSQAKTRRDDRGTVGEPAIHEQEASRESF